MHIIVFDDPHFECRDYSPWLGYGQSKTANALFAVALDERGKKDGMRAFSLHPGSIFGTGLEKYLSVEELRASGSIDEQGNPVLDVSRNLKTVEQGAATIVWCATSPQLDGIGGVYCENCDIAPLEVTNLDNLSIGDSTQIGGVMPYATNAETAERLWKLSERLVFGE